MTDKSPKAFERLYKSSEENNIAGKEKRLEIERKIAERHDGPEWSHRKIHTKIPLSQAEEFYKKSVRRAIEKDEKLAAVALERDRTYEAQFQFNGVVEERVGEDSRGVRFSLLILS